MKTNIDVKKFNESIKECPDRFTQVLVEKTDLDTIGSFFMHKLAGRIEDDCAITSLRGQALPEQLNNPQTLCIECGGSGDIDKGNFDHHAEGGPEESATLQTLKTLPKSKLSLEIIHLANYIDSLDRYDQEQIKLKYQNTVFPTLSDIVAGINLKHFREPVVALKTGSQVIENILATGQKPTGPISGFDEFAELKKNNDEQIDLVRKNVKFLKTSRGNYIGHLETKFFGAPNIIYQEGLKKYGTDETIVAVAHNPKFGPENNENKFTIGLNHSPQIAKEKDISLKKLADKLNDPSLDSVVDLEKRKTWGGPPTGTVIGSPKGGTNLNMKQVLSEIEKLY